MPVMLPPGRATLAAKPEATGSPADTMMMGIVVVAFWAVRTARSPTTTSISTLRATSSAACA